MSEIVRAEPAQIVKFDKEQIELIKGQIMPGATDSELKFFEAICTRTQLDPFARQIFAVKRKVNEGGQWIEKWTPQTSVDGFRLIAERTGRYEGQPETLWCGPDKKWTDVWLNQKAPAAAKVGVFKKGHRAATYAVARFVSYAVTKRDGGLTKMWAKMPDLMIAKCAECLALRKAFPQELSGLYAAEEMGQAAPIDVSPNNDQKAGNNAALTAGNGQKTGNPPENTSPGGYVIQYGKRKGQSLKEFPAQNWANWLLEIEAHYHDTKTDPTLACIADQNAVKAYIAQAVERSNNGK